MSLTLGLGPFGQRPWGTFGGLDRPDRVAYLEPSPRRVRVVFEGVTVADSARACLLYETGFLPSYYFPVDDVRTDLLIEVEPGRTSPLLGRARSWTVRVGERTAPGAAYGWWDPPSEAPPVNGLITFTFRDMDEWYEEDDRILGHPNDPYHRIDVRASSRHVRLSHRGTLLAESVRPLLLFETGMLPRFYLPPEDVSAELLPSDQHTRCPYKGVASYWSVRAGDEVLSDLVWYYPDPLPEAARIAGALAFFDERLEVDVDGQRLASHETQWSNVPPGRIGDLRAPMRD